MKLNIGCGHHPEDSTEWENLDINPMRDFIKKINLETDTLPYAENSIDHIRATDVLEHLGDGLIHCMNECHRVLHREGTFYIEVPKFPHPDSVKDPTHKRFFIKETFDYFTKIPDAYVLYGIRSWVLKRLEEKEHRLLVWLSPEK